MERFFRVTTDPIPCFELLQARKVNRALVDTFNLVVRTALESSPMSHKTGGKVSKLVRVVRC